MTKANCYTCQYRRNVPGDAHSKCEHPDTQDSHNQVIAMAAFMQGFRSVQFSDQMTVEGVAHGIRMGWFMFPVNYDPTWLVSCTGYTSMQEDTPQKSN
jgi:hypothetical protein